MRLNLGCGYSKLDGWVNVDLFEICEPDVIHDLNEPFPWEDNSIEQIVAIHTMEHLHNWWGAFCECARVLEPGGTVEIRVPHPGSDTALCYRDHLTVINKLSFHGIIDGPINTRNAWFESQEKIPVYLVKYEMVPVGKYNWMPNWLMKWCAEHLRNIIYEQRFLFVKV